MKISEKIARLKAVDIDHILNDALRASEKAILDLTREQLYEKGVIDVNDPSKRETYAAATIAQKRRKATFKKTDFVTLRWMGDFYDKFKLLIFKDRIVVSSTDLKWVNFLEPNPRFENALGLTDDSVKKVRDMVLPLILKRIKI
jgi:hypothetical protein